MTQEELKQILYYDPNTGEFRWLNYRHGIRADGIAGHETTKGRIEIEIDGKVYQAPRLAYLYVTGKWPECQIDHINCIRNDNRWDNLRNATQSQNQANRPPRKGKKFKLKGVSIKPHLPKPYVAQICKDGKYYHLGCFSTEEEAHEAYRKAANKLHGEFARYD